MSPEEPALAAAHKASSSETAATLDASFKAALGLVTAEGHKPQHKASASPAVRALAREYGVDLTKVVSLTYTS
jgi:pyruvate/2-oxoglutarate dehydrogenase complex dihydrolipoamide acyltransferase (E2) component